MCIRDSPDGQVFAIIPPAIRDLGNASGFDLELEDQAGLGHNTLVQAEGQLLGMAAHDPLLAGVRPNAQADTPQLDLDIDQAKAGALGLSLADISATVSAAAGASYINDFNDRGRVKHVYLSLIHICRAQRRRAACAGEFRLYRHTGG